MEAFAGWLRESAPGRALVIGDNASFDWQSTIPLTPACRSPLGDERHGAEAHPVTRFGRPSFYRRSQRRGWSAQWPRRSQMHIGLIGGIGPAATEYYYRGLIERHARSNTRLELTIAHADARELVHNLANDDAGRQAEVFARLVRRLAAAGARAAAVTSMGGHFCIGELEAISPLPI